MIQPDIATARRWLAALALTLTGLAGCGAGHGGTAGTAPGASGNCDPPSGAGCGEVIVALTDADGDFLSYTVDVLSLELERADGTLVETLPRSVRLDFAQYVELAELLTVASVPPGTYVSGRLRLDYSSAEVYLDKDGEAAEALVVDADGDPLGAVDITVMLDHRDALVVRRGSGTLLVVDFDLAASHEVDLSITPALAGAQPVLVASVSPVEQKILRLRGPLVSVDTSAASYTIGVRPFHLRDGEFGRATVHVEPGTSFEIDGVLYSGEAGLAELAAHPTGTPTVAFGTLVVAEREFTAEQVLAGSSVPGATHDVIHGNVVARVGDLLSVRGATLIRRNGSVVFRDEASIEVGIDTRVVKVGDPHGDLDIAAISVGQRLHVFGELVDDTPGSLVMDANPGWVRLELTHLGATANGVLPGQINVALQSIDRRRIALFDFSGTGLTTALDADPDDYEVATGSLELGDVAPGTPLRVHGFVRPFMAAPPDFDGRTVVDLAASRARLVIGWGEDGTSAPFASLGPEGLLLDLANPDIGERHHIVVGGIAIDLLELDAAPLIAPPASGRGLFAIARQQRVRVFSRYADFLDALTAALDGATQTRGLHAIGGYQAAGREFTAHRISVLLD